MLCTQCPATGGACDGEVGYYGEGKRPSWEDDTLTPEPCERWGGYAKRRMLAAAGLPPTLLDVSFDSYEPKNESQVQALAKVRAFAQHARPSDRMLIQGPTGIGKTHLAAAALQHLSERASVMFAYVPELVDAVRSEMLGGSTATMDRALGVAFLVLDDLGAERSTDFVRETLEKLCNSRQVRKHSIIFTQNVTPEQIAQSLGLPLMRRVMYGTATVVKIEGQPYR